MKKVPTDNRSLLEWSTQLLHEASSVTLQYFRKNLRTSDKPGHQGIVTEADIATENFLKERILDRDPRALFLAEESFNATDVSGSLQNHFARYQNGQKLWIIDPIDGTTNFSKGNPYYCLSVCCGSIDESGKFQAEIGLVMHPVAGDLYSGAHGQGAFRGKSRLQIASHANLERASFCTGFGYFGALQGLEKSSYLEAVIKTTQSLQESCLGLRINGAAALDIAQTAAGVFDGFYELNLQPWDMAAGALIAREAGLRVSNISGKPYEEFRDNGIIVCHPKLYDHLLSELTRHFGHLEAAREKHP